MSTTTTLRPDWPSLRLSYNIAGIGRAEHQPRSNVRPWASNAQIVRAILLASATIATFFGRLDSNPFSHGSSVRSARLCWLSTVRAP